MMNATYVFVIGVITRVKFVGVVYDELSYHDILFAWLPMVTSTTDPIIILWRRKGARRRVKEMLCATYNNNYWSGSVNTAGWPV